MSLIKNNNEEAKCLNLYQTKNMSYIFVPKKRSIDIDTKFEYDLVRSMTK